MKKSIASGLQRALKSIDRPGSFAVAGSVAAVLPGLEVDGLGPVAVPLSAGQARDLAERCEQAPYGKGEETLVDTSVRRVWRLKPDRFRLTNPDWAGLLRGIVETVQEGLGLEGQKLESHLYDLLLYEPGGFFLPHRDGEKLDRMVATLVVVLPSDFAGGELVVRHDGQEQTFPLGDAGSRFRVHYAGFYADCEHEIRPLREGHRLCLVYNLTLARGKKLLAAPRHGDATDRVAVALAEWASDAEARKLVVTLDHQYTADGLTWDALKGTDRVKARVLAEAARRADCKAHLALLTFHESGAAEYTSRRRYGEESEYEMIEVFESTLTASRWSDSGGTRLPITEMPVAEDELLDPEVLESVEPEEDFSGYTGNEGMTLERWYRHAAIIVWPARRHYATLCDAGSRAAVAALAPMVKRWQASKKDAALKAECLAFAREIINRWAPAPRYAFLDEDYEESETGEPELLPLLAALDDGDLIGAYLRSVPAADATVDPSGGLPALLDKHGWATYRDDLLALVAATTRPTLERNVRIVEQIALAKAKKKAGWAELCAALAGALVPVVERIDAEPLPPFHHDALRRKELLPGLARALLAAGQEVLLDRLVSHVLGLPAKYPLREVHVPVLTALQPWLKKQVKEPSPSLARWLTACREQLEALTATMPQPPADFRRDANVRCDCAVCTELKTFLRDPREREHRLRAAQATRTHLEHSIRGGRCDLDCRTERKGSPHTLVCSKNTASYQAALAQYHKDQEYLATVRAIEAALPGE